LKLKNTFQKKGDIAEILGLFDTDENIIAEKILIYERWKNDLIFISSIFAITSALYLFFKNYSFKRKTYRFKRWKQDA